jgi:hypothetical protein
VSLALAPTETLGADVLAHLEAQLASSRRLLEIVLRQGAAIRAQEVEAVVALMAELQAEMDVRASLELDRTQLLDRAGAQLGVPGHAITLEALATLLVPADAALARERSAELRGLLAEISREHAVNRALMRQELAFLDHLTRLLAGGADLGYRHPADGGGEGMRVGTARPIVHRVLDLEA